MYADFLLPFILYYVAKRKSFRTLLPSVLLCGYGMVVGVVSVISQINDYFFVAVLGARAVAFVVVFEFYRRFINLSLSRWVRFGITIGVLAALATSVYRVVFEVTVVNAYSPVSLLGTHAPAITGFMLASVSIYFLFFSVLRSDWKVGFIGIIAALLALWTLTISATVAFLGAFLAGIVAWALFRLPFPKIKFSRYIFAVIVFFGVVFWERLAGFFWRIGHLPRKLAYRLDKMDASFTGSCDSVFCTLFGNGPGADSYLKALEYGKTSLLGFDQLYGRLIFEWGIVGFFLWLIWFTVSTKPIFKRDNQYFVRPLMIVVLAFGFVFGFGSEFIFVSYSGAIFAVLLGLAYHDVRPIGTGQKADV
ncbi:hypothetical protein [Marinobacterium sp. xm-d-530]|uniref:hypothetical protein n=1 Tax=Marinobacterium sp. xm-d-530 TaxID=2497747 RepID=UPI001568EFF7|nr:hypothetical protein [Marinobacterium sp. xm-d-530]NRQ01173.1 hypothetical protein [Marinobacterium sp. xm-d-530]